MIFSSPQKLNKIKNQYKNSLLLNDNHIERVEKFKFLGVVIKEDLKWNEQVNAVVKKLNKSVAILSRLKHFLPSGILLGLYNTLFLPHIIYCIGVWGLTEDYNKNRISILQKRAIRCVDHASYCDHTKPIFDKYHILTFMQLLELNIGTFMFKYNNNLLPSPFNNYFSLSNVHGHNTRTASNVRIESHNTARYSKTTKITAPKIWNKLPLEIKNAKSLQSFKKNYKKLLHSESHC